MRTGVGEHLGSGVQARDPEVAAEEMQLLRTLMAACTPEKFDLAKYQDRYTQRLTQLIEAKVAGQEIVAAPATTQLQVINLVEALRVINRVRRQRAGAGQKIAAHLWSFGRAFQHALAGGQ